MPTFNREYPVYPDVEMDSDGDITVNPNNSFQILYCLINDVPAESDWCNFEECLGLLEYQEILDLVDRDEENLFHYYYNLEDTVSNLKTSLPFSLLNIFVEWVDGINYPDAKPKYYLLDTDMFLTFNYTPVLEEIYGIKSENICHIHGSLSEKLCIVGHCNNDREFNEYDDVVAFQLEQIHKQLIKPTSELYHNNISFFKKLYKIDISEIVFFGFFF